MKPYYKQGDITIYCGDCREVLPGLKKVESIITDPVWPNALASLAGSEDPYGLFQEFCEILPKGLERLVIELGCDSDPRFLQCVPDRLKIIRVCWLDYLIPSYKGRILYTGDVAYAFGKPPSSIPGRRLLSGKCTSRNQDKIFARKTGRNRTGRRTTALPAGGLPHPSPRRLDHAKWLVKNFSEAQVVDPFMGSGTMAVAAKQMNRQFIGIEIKEEYCELAVKRLRQTVMKIDTNPGPARDEGVKNRKLL